MLADISWFGKKVPAKRRFNGRGATNTLNQQNSINAEEEYPTISYLRGKALFIEGFYAECTKPHDREWTEDAKKKQWISNVQEASSVS